MTERLTDRDEIIDALLEKVQYAAAVQLEAHSTNDDEDALGNRLDPIHDYAEGLVECTTPLAVLAIALILGRGGRT